MDVSQQVTLLIGALAMVTASVTLVTAIVVLVAAVNFSKKLP